jgi:hypothetical protein
MQDHLRAELANIEPPRLPRGSVSKLREAIAPLMLGKPAAAVEALVDSLDVSLALFREWERRETRKRPSETKRELRQLARHIDTLQACVRRLSAAARDEMDVEMLPGFGLPESLLAVDRPFAFKNPYVESGADEPQLSKATESAPPSTLYIDPVLVTLVRLRKAIDRTLGTDNKGGAPLRLPWHHLAWEVARAMEQHLGVSTFGGQFEQLLRACLEVGLSTFRPRRRVPDDLRSYTRSAMKSLRASRARIKPSPK